MNILTGNRENYPHDLPQTGSYEWWYLDIISEDADYSLVVIFFRGMPFLPEYNVKANSVLEKQSDANISLSGADYPAISFCLYKKGKAVYNLHNIFSKESFKFEHDHDTDYLLQIGESYIRRTGNNIKLKFESRLPYSSKIIKAEAEFELKITASNFSNIENKHSHHNWLPVAPICNAKCKIEIISDNKNLQLIKFKGSGYHDKNWGTKPLFYNIKSWKWGRSFFGRYSTIYFLVEYTDSEPFSLLVLTDIENKTVKIFHDFMYEETSSKNYWRLEYPEELIIKADGLELQNINTCKSDNGPFYIRFVSDFILKIDDMILKAKGHSEIIIPARLKSSLLKPFVNLKIHKR